MTLKVRPKPALQLPTLPAGLPQGRIWHKNASTGPLAEGPAGTEAIDLAYLFIEIGKVILSRYKELLAESPGAVDRYRLSEGASVRELHGTGTKVRAAIGDALEDEDFIDAGKWTFSALEEAYAEVHCVERPAASLAINRLLERAGLITIRTNAPSLKRV